MKNNIFKEACLIQLSTSCWQGSRSIDPSIMEQIGNSEWIRGRKYLVDQEALAPTRSVINRARKELDQMALPFPISGLTLVPKDCLERVEAKLSEYKDEYWGEVELFVEGYEQAREMAKTFLGTLYNDRDYPMLIRQKFGFDWRYLIVETPGKNKLLTPEIYERERQKFTAMMTETRELAVRALREEFADYVDHMVERLTQGENGKPKVIKESKVQRFMTFLDSFDSRNLFHDDELSRLVDSAKELLTGVEPGALRQDEDLRESVKKRMAEVKEEMDNALVDLPRRKIQISLAA
jgi:hypothetical protein